MFGRLVFNIKKDILLKIQSLCCVSQNSELCWVSLVASLVSVATTNVGSATSSWFWCYIMLKKRIHNHDNNQTNSNNNLKRKTNFKKQPEKMLLRIRCLQQLKKPNNCSATKVELSKKRVKHRNRGAVAGVCICCFCSHITAGWDCCS